MYLSTPWQIPSKQGKSVSNEQKKDPLLPAVDVVMAVFRYCFSKIWRAPKDDAIRHIRDLHESCLLRQRGERS